MVRRRIVSNNSRKMSESSSSGVSDDQGLAKLTKKNVLIQQLSIAGDEELDAPAKYLLELQQRKHDTDSMRAQVRD